MHKFKTKAQTEEGGQLQGWHLNLAGMQLNWFLKSKSQWNCLFCSKRRRFIHCSLKKRELKTMLFWIGTSSSSLDVLQAGEEKDYSPATSLSLSLSNINPKIDMTNGLPLDEKMGGGGQALRAAAQWPLDHPTFASWLDRGRVALSPPFPLINTRDERTTREEDEEKQRKKRGKKLKQKWKRRKRKTGEKKWRKGKGRKNKRTGKGRHWKERNNRGEKTKKNWKKKEKTETCAFAQGRRKMAATTTYRHTAPPWAIVSNDVALTARLAFLFFFPASTIPANEQWRVHCSWVELVPTQTKILGRVWPSIIRKENVGPTLAQPFFGPILAQLVWAELNPISSRPIST